MRQFFALVALASAVPVALGVAIVSTSSESKHGLQADIAFFS